MADGHDTQVRRDPKGYDGNKIKFRNIEEKFAWERERSKERMARERCESNNRAVLRRQLLDSLKVA